MDREQLLKQEIDKIVAFAKEKAVGFAVVAPDDPLVLGCADALRAIGIPTFGPSKAAAEVMACISAWAVTSVSVSVRLCARAIT